MKFLNFAFKVLLLELCSRVCTIDRDYKEVFNPRILRYEHGKCSYCMKIIISRGRNSDRRWTFVERVQGRSIKTVRGVIPGINIQ
jgi:hypothetical protein